MMNEKLIRDRLIKHGKKLFNTPRKFNHFTKIHDADVLLNDIENYPHAFVLACIMDQQIKAERAWLIPYQISKKIGGFSMELLSRLSLNDVIKLMSEPEIRHRFIEKMSNYFFSAIKLINKKYLGNAAKIWENNPSSAEVVYRFLEFDGIGPKIGSMAANILAREFKIPFSDYYSIDISADVHVKRVFSRLGLCPNNATVEQVIYKARALYPRFPGMMDLPSWEIGRNWCKPHTPICSNCYMNDLCINAEKLNNSNKQNLLK